MGPPHPPHGSPTPPTSPIPETGRTHVATSALTQQRIGGFHDERRGNKPANGRKVAVTSDRGSRGPLETPVASPLLLLLLLMFSSSALVIVQGPPGSVPYLIQWRELKIKAQPRRPAGVHVFIGHAFSIVAKRRANVLRSDFDPCLASFFNPLPVSTEACSVPPARRPGSPTPNRHKRQIKKGFDPNSVLIQSQKNRKCSVALQLIMTQQINREQAVRPRHKRARRALFSPLISADVWLTLL